MSKQDRDLTALIGSRICHDLISPLGAIGNGLELLQLSGMGDSPEMALISESVTNANLRIRYFRIAYGAASPGQMISENEIRAVTSPGPDARKLKINWTPTGDMSRQTVKLALLLLQCIETAMPWGGQVEVTQNGDQWSIYASAEKMKVEPALWQMITIPNQQIDLPAAQVQFALVGPEFADQSRRAQIELGANSIRIDF